MLMVLQSDGVACHLLPYFNDLDACSASIQEDAPWCWISMMSVTSSNMYAVIASEWSIYMLPTFAYNCITVSAASTCRLVMAGRRTMISLGLLLMLSRQAVSIMWCGILLTSIIDLAAPSCPSVAIQDCVSPTCCYLTPCEHACSDCGHVFMCQGLGYLAPTGWLLERVTHTAFISLRQALRTPCSMDHSSSSLTSDSGRGAMVSISVSMTSDSAMSTSISVSVYGLLGFADCKYGGRTSRMGTIMVAGPGSVYSWNSLATVYCVIVTPTWYFASTTLAILCRWL